MSLSLALDLHPFDRATGLLKLDPGLVHTSKLKAALPPTANYFIAKNACRRGGSVNCFQLHARLRWAVARVRPKMRAQPTLGQQPVVEVDDTVLELELGEEPFSPAEL